MGHGAALLGRLEALRENPALRAFLRTLQRRPQAQPQGQQPQQQEQGERGREELERSVEEMLFARLEDLDPEALVSKASVGGGGECVYIYVCMCACRWEKNAAG